MLGLERQCWLLAQAQQLWPSQQALLGLSPSPSVPMHSLCVLSGPEAGAHLPGHLHCVCHPPLGSSAAARTTLVPSSALPEVILYLPEDSQGIGKSQVRGGPSWSLALLLYLASPEKQGGRVVHLPQFTGCHAARYKVKGCQVGQEAAAVVPGGEQERVLHGLSLHLL